MRVRIQERIFVAACVVLVLFFVVGVVVAKAAFHTPALDNLASYFADRPVKVACRSVEEDWNLDSSWGYVWKPTGKQGWTYIRDTACLGALAIDLDVPEITDYMKAIGVAVVVHESFHLRRVKFNESEPHTECRAMQNYDKALRMLGAEPETMARLMPLMLLQHAYLRARVPAYNKVDCTIPRRYDEWRGSPPRDD